MKEVPIKETLSNKLSPNVKYNVLDTDKVLGYINHRLYTDVKSYAILEMSRNGKKAVAVEVWIPVSHCWNQKAAEEINGVPNKICQNGNPFEIKFTYGKWREDKTHGEILGSTISEHCGYHYDIYF